MKRLSKKTSKPKRDLNKYPRGWNPQRIQDLIKHYERQTDDKATTEDEAAFNDPEQAVVLVPRALLPQLPKLLAAHAARK